MDKRLLALLIAAAALFLHGCTRGSGGPVGNMSDGVQNGSYQGPDWRS